MLISIPSGRNRRMEFRHEYKFIISVSQSAILQSRLSGLMERDSHGGRAGGYEIRSIYFDDMNNTCYRQNEAGTDPRAKYRIRIYNASGKKIVLEKKIKQNGMTRKLHEDLGMEQYGMLMKDSFETFFFDEPPLVQELLALKQMRRMEPKVIVAYDRTPFVEKNGNVRITFDDHISSSPDFEGFFGADLHKRPVLPVGKTLMEVKFDEFLPEYIKETLELGHLSQTNFSKYYLCRRYSL